MSEVIKLAIDTHLSFVLFFGEWHRLAEVAMLVSPLFGLWVRQSVYTLIRRPSGTDGVVPPGRL